VEARADRAADPPCSQHHDPHRPSLGTGMTDRSPGFPLMTLGAWILVAAVAAAAGIGTWWSLTNGVFRGTRRVRGGPETGAGHLVQPPVASVLAGTTYDAARGERATLLQFSSAFCAPCRGDPEDPVGRGPDRARGGARRGRCGSTISTWCGRSECCARRPRCSSTATAES
jgi:hypothetical protein